MKVLPAIGFSAALAIGGAAPALPQEASTVPRLKEIPWGASKETVKQIVPLEECRTGTGGEDCIARGLAFGEARTDTAVFRFQNDQLVVWALRYPAGDSDEVEAELVERFGQPVAAAEKDGATVTTWKKTAASISHDHGHRRVTAIARGYLHRAPRRAGPPEVPTEAEALPQIRAKCAKDWPDDFKMRLECEEAQLDALRKLRQR